MDKKLLFGTLVLCSYLSVTAQTNIWADDFNDLDISDWTLIDADGDNYNWFVVQIEDTEGPVGTPIMRSLSWSGESELTPDNWIISPAINLGNASGQINLSWEAMAIDTEWDDENYTVYVATESNITSLEASPVNFNEVLSGTNTLTSRTLDISAFAGETIYVAFRHHNSTGQFSMELDNVEITATTLNINESTLTSFTIYPNPATNVITISNIEKQPVTSISITDSNGRNVKNELLESFTEAKVDISELQNGVYFVKIASGEEICLKKIIVNN